MTRYVLIDGCRICGNQELLPVLDLGQQALTGVFPLSREEPDLVAPLEVVKCSPAGCGLVQLLYDVDLELMYGERYGYRSGIRPFMIQHLRGKVEQLTAMVGVGEGDLVLDIGSNDGTLLSAYPDGPQLVGFDPSAEKFRELYPPGADLTVDFFSREAFVQRYGDRKAKIVTSIAMFYDLPDPMSFVQDVRDVLDDDGIWMVEHSYLPSMLETNGYDNICHEHLEFYALQQIEWMAERTGLTLLSAEVTDVYGGSLCSILARNPDRHPRDDAGLSRLRSQEAASQLDSMVPFEAFGQRVRRHREQIGDFLERSRAEGKRTLGYGASTKGNVILQYCGLTEDDLGCIGEVNPEKEGCFTPGTKIPIVSEDDAKARRPDQLLVFPWIHRGGFVEREQQFMADGGKLVFPLPELEVM